MNQFKNTVRLLRFHFSLFLLPISLFSFFYLQPPLNAPLLLVLFIWHLLVFPSSNGYNSYHDRDEGPIGGLAAPPKPTGLLIHTSNVMDVVAIFLSFALNYRFAFFVTVYIIVSRLYSHRIIRLKKFPFIGFLVVFIFQGAWVFCANIFALSDGSLILDPCIAYSAIASSCFIGTIYPLTQIYQHEADGKDGVKTLSMLLGIRGTFLFSMGMFLLATCFIYLAFRTERLSSFLIFSIVMLPAMLYFFYWALRSFKNAVHVNFKNTMTMLVLSSALNNLFFLILLFN
jgi:1,4-dihydroxy-2-naphthoate octaprenyltransferase